jgi:hypothetical protein
LHDKPFGGQAPKGLRHSRLRHAEARGDIDLPGLPAIRDQICDQLDIVLQQRVPTGSPGLPKPLGMLRSIQKLGRSRLGLRPA